MATSSSHVSGTPGGGVPRAVASAGMTQPSHTSAFMPSSYTSALACESLCLAWEDMQVVQDISLQVEPGEICCLVGRSGCGKTTLFHGLAGLSQPQAGAVFVHGVEVTGRPGQVSYMLQKDLLLPSRTIMDNVCLPLVIGGMSKAAARTKAAPLFERFGLAGTERSWPSQLSGGMRQRAALLRTYLMDNDVILLDEPFSALDALTRTDIRSWFMSIAAELGISALVITHDVDEAVMLAHRVYVMKGRPQAGIPSRLVGSVVVEHSLSSGDLPFDLSDEYLRAKRAIHALLEEGEAAPVC